MRTWWDASRKRIVAHSWRRRWAPRYHSAANRTIFDVKKEIPPVDLAVEATGVASVAFDGMQILGRNGVLCLLSLTGGSTTAHQPIENINHQLVLGNQVVFGSVNANPRHFAMGLKDFSDHRKEVAWRTETTHHDEAAVGSVRQVVRADEFGNQNDA